MYTKQSALEQFKTRVYLKESVRQIGSLGEPIKEALNTLEITSKRDR